VGPLRPIADKAPAWRREWTFVAGCLLALAALLAAYSNHFDNDFHFDDSHVILNNLSIRSLHDVGRYFTDPLTFTSHPQNATYRPLLTLSFALDYRIGGGLEPRQFHRTQFGLLLVLGALLVLCFGLWYDAAEPSPWNRWSALAAATLFCIHTANTETVNYISSRSSLLATLGVVASFVTYSIWPRGRRTLLYLVPVLLAGLAKPLTVMFAPLLLVFVLLHEERQAGKRAAGRLAGALLRTAPAFVACGSLYVFLRSMEPETLEYSHVDRWTYAHTQPFVWLHYARLFLAPRQLTADPDWSWVKSWSDPRFIVGSAFVLALVGAIVLLSRAPRMRPLAFGLAWFAVALLPTSSIIPLSEVYSEHHIFFPYVGLAAAAGWGVPRALRRLAGPRAAAPIGAALALGVIAAHGVGTHSRNAVWRTEETLWEDVTVKSPQNGRGLMNYGLTQMRAGRTQQALTYFERAQPMLPDYSILEINLGIVKSALGDPKTAERHFRRALRLTPDYAAGHYYYAKWLTENGRTPAAIPHLERAIALSPGDSETNRLLLEIHAAMGDREALELQSSRVLRISPGDGFARALASGKAPYPIADSSAAGLAAAGLERLQRRDWLAASIVYRSALALEPRSATSWNNLGWALASAGCRDLALASFERALEIEPDQEHARRNLAWVRQRYSTSAAAEEPSP